jgi:hypothetical protein
MVGVDLEPDSTVPLPVDVHHGAERRDGLSKSDRSATVEDTEWLSSSLVHRHLCDDPLWRELGELDAEDVGEAAGREAFEPGEGFT